MDRHIKTVAACLAILVGTLACLLAAAGISRLMHWLDARPGFVAAAQPWLFLTTLVLVGVAAIQMARRRAD